MKRRLKRMKRSNNFGRIVEFTIDNSPYFISKNITIHAEQILRVQSGTNLIFSQNSGITAHGKRQPFKF